MDEIPTYQELRSFMLECLENHTDISEIVKSSKWDASFKVLCKQDTDLVNELYEELVQTILSRFQEVIRNYDAPGILLQLKLECCEKQFTYWRTLFHNVAAVFHLMKLSSTPCDIAITEYLTKGDHWLKPIITMTDYKLVLGSRVASSYDEFLYEYPIQIQSDTSCEMPEQYA